MTAPAPAVRVRDAATVMLVRDGDRHADLEAVCEGRTDDEASRLLGVDRGGLAYWVAGIRECFEEAGVLLAHVAGGGIVRLGDPDVAERFGVHRRAVDRGERRLIDVCADEGLRLAVGEMHYFSHWITPVGAPRRYDTRFFVARAPDDQEPLHDAGETVAHCWIRPGDALERGEAGELDLMPPTVRNLEAIDRFDRADDLLGAAAATTDVPTVQPRVVDDGGGWRIVLPGDRGFGDAAG